MDLLDGRARFARAALWSLAVLAVALAGSAEAATGTPRVGVAGAVNPRSTGQPPEREMRTLSVGSDLVFEERIQTSEAGQVHIMFLDGSTLTVGGNADLTIDKFVYDPETSTGDLAVSISKGIFRFVGGKISKTSEVTFDTPSSHVGIRGGVIQGDVNGATGEATQTFLFGEYMKVATGEGVEQVSDPGFAVTTTGLDLPPGQPFQATPQMIAAGMAQTEGAPGSTGGTNDPPSDSTVASSGLAVIGSDNDPAGLGPPAAGGSGQSGGQSTTTPTDPSTIGNTVDTQQAGQNNAAQSSGLTLQTNFSGRFKATTAGTPLLGTLDGTAAANRAYGNGKITNGRFIANLGGSPLNIPVASSPGVALAFGSAGTSSLIGPVSGSSIVTPGGDFFFANLFAAGSDRRAVVFGGVPVPQSELTGSGVVEFTSFSLLPDPILGNSIPFVRPSAGGNVAGAVISPVIAADKPTLGTLAATPGNASRTSALQASLAIDGAGAAQKSTLGIMTGVLLTNDDSGKVGFVGGYRASSRLTATDETVRTQNAIQTVTDNAGNHFFGIGDNTFFMVDDAKFGGNPNTDQIRVEGTDDSVSFEFTEDFNPPGVAIGNNHIAVPTSNPAGIGASRTLRDTNGAAGTVNAVLGGYTAGFVTTTTFGPVAQTSYAFDSGLDPVAGVKIATFPGLNRMSAQFNLEGPDSGAQFDTLQANFGGTNTANDIFSLPAGESFFSTRSSFVDDDLFAARESIASDGTVNGDHPTTLRNGTSVDLAQAALVTYDVVENGVDPCTCEFLEWGYWTGRVRDFDAQNTHDTFHIVPWVGGVVPTLAEIPGAGVANYSGPVQGNVINAGAQYLATGDFTKAWNFATRSGNVTINNFDGLNSLATPVAASVPNPRDYSGSTAGLASGVGAIGNVTLDVNGSFFKGGADPVAATAGTFGITNGGSYMATGTFMGDKVVP